MDFFLFCFAKEKKIFKKSLGLSLLNVGLIGKHCPVLILFSFSDVFAGCYMG